MIIVNVINLINYIFKSKQFIYLNTFLFNFYLLIFETINYMKL